MNDVATDILIGVLMAPFVLVTVLVFVMTGVNKVRKNHER